MRCIAVDDEPLALSIIENFCSKVPFLELEATATNGIEAIEKIKNGNFDLLFIDINMPNINGIEVVKMLTKPILVIFTTAYQNYALTGFELSAIDYLVKPFSFDRFFSGVSKAQKQWELINNSSKNMANEQSTPLSDKYIMIRSETSIVKVMIDDILYIEGLKDYVKLYLTSGSSLITKSTMKKIEEYLNPMGFARIHKSFIINLIKINSFENNHIIIESAKIPLGNQFRERFFNYIEKNKL